MPPFTLLSPEKITSPFMLDSPHSGRDYPEDFNHDCPRDLLRYAEDAFVDLLIQGAVDVGMSVLIAHAPRCYIDLNRARDDINPHIIDGVWPEPIAPTPMTLNGFGLIRNFCMDGMNIHNAPLPVATIQKRIAHYYDPYHAELERVLHHHKSIFGVGYLLDFHSMSSQTSPMDFILGDRGGTSCDPHLTQTAKIILQDLGYRVAVNHPYQGREILRRHGKPNQHQHAMQIEINRKLYLNEKNPRAHHRPITKRFNGVFGEAPQINPA